MFIEIDTTDLIAFLIKKSDFSDFIQIPFSKVFYLGKTLEFENEDILVSCDAISIDAFRCIFPSNVIVEESVIKIVDTHKIRHVIERLLPSQRIMDLFEDIYNRKF